MKDNEFEYRLDDTPSEITWSENNCVSYDTRDMVVCIANDDWKVEISNETEEITYETKENATVSMDEDAIITMDVE